MDIKDIEQRIIWRKLRGEYLRNSDQHIFHPDGSTNSFDIPLRSPKYSIQVVLNGHVLTDNYYILTNTGTFLDVYLDVTISPNSMLIFNMLYDKNCR